MKADDKFKTEVINEDEQQVTLMTKTHTGKVLSVVNVRPTIFEVLGEDFEFAESFDQKSKGRSSLVQNLKKNNTEIRRTVIRPTKVANQYVQVLIEQVLEGGRIKKSTMITQDMKGKVLSTQELDKSVPLEGNLHLETLFNDKKSSVFLVVKNEDDKIVAKQELKEGII